MHILKAISCLSLPTIYFLILQLKDNDLYDTSKLHNKNIGHHARLRENKHLFCCRALACRKSSCTRVHTLMTQKSCAVGMRNAILRNHLNRISTIYGKLKWFKLVLLPVKFAMLEFATCSLPTG